MSYSETIVAQVTSPGKSSVGILRVSGVQAKEVVIQVLGKIPIPRFATYSKFLDDHHKVLDRGISLWFPAPNSFTGEDVFEFQGHGNPILIDFLIKRILSIQGLRLAKPGEFSERAFLNGKIDLIQAESIDDLINSETEQSIRASLNSLQGDFSFRIHELTRIIIKLRTYVESSIDFSEDEINIELENIVYDQFKKLKKNFLEIKTIAKEGSILRESKKIVIAGLPNAGKSSLLNALTCSDRAIVTSVPGTTRDVLHENVNINGIVFELIDTAGLRDIDDEVEKIGVLRAWKAIEASDHVLFVIDKTIRKSEQKKISNEFLKHISNNIKVTFVLSKNDLVSNNVQIDDIEDASFITVSSYTGEGINKLREYIVKNQINSNKESIFIARRRHIHQINLSLHEFKKAQKNWLLYKNIELLAESLSLINKMLGEITGRFTSNDLLENIFSSFCIGK